MTGNHLNSTRKNQLNFKLSITAPFVHPVDVSVSFLISLFFPKMYLFPLLSPQEECELHLSQTEGVRYGQYSGACNRPAVQTIYHETALQDRHVRMWERSGESASLEVAVNSL